MNTQENVSEQPLTHTPKTENVSTKKKPRGKGAKAKSSKAFVTSSNAKYMQQQREAAMKRLGVFNCDAEQLEASLKSMMVTVQPRAIPLPIATRGAGFATVAEFSRMTSAWNQATIEVICTIHQYYRVTLFLITFKIYYARYVQHKEESFPMSNRFIMNEEYRQVLQTVSQVPISTYNILCSIGTVEGETAFNSYLPSEGLDYGQDVALYLTPFNIREAVVQLSDPATQEVHRRSFFELNPLPAARWTDVVGVGPVLQNPDAIWPADYGVATLQADVHAYSNLLTRAGNRLPKSFLVNFEWNAHGAKPCTVCFHPAPSRLQAQFQRRQVAVTRRKTRQADGTSREVEVPTDEYDYQGDTQTGVSAVIECWAVDGSTTAMEMTVGVATYVGEVERIQSRLQIQGRQFSHISPGNVLHKLVDAPRP